MNIKNTINNIISKRRWLKKLIQPVDDIGWLNLKNNFKLFYYLKDLYGPSFYMSYGKDKGFELYEKIERDEILKNLPEDGTFFDIGANIGLFSFYINQHKKGLKTYSFEPHPILFKCLKMTKESNSIKNININNIGLGDSPGEFKLYLSEINAGGHSLSVNASDKNKSRYVNVNVSTLDDFCLEKNIQNIDVIKIDVEGFEKFVLLGGIDSLKKFKPCLLIECSNDELANNNGIIKYFKDHNLKSTFKVCGESHFLEINQLQDIARQNLQKNRPLDNYFFKLIE